MTVPHLPNLVVLSYNEVTWNTKIESIASWRMRNDRQEKDAHLCATTNAASVPAEGPFRQKCLSLSPANVVGTLRVPSACYGTRSVPDTLEAGH